MSDIAIRVEGLGKQYRIGKRQASYGTLRDSLAEAFTAPFKRLRRNGNSQFAIRNSQSDDTIWALRDVSFEVKRGEVVGIIGRNGAGKSTLLKVLSRITEPTEGEVDIYGRVASLLEVGTGFHPELTGRENIYLNGSILGMKRVEIQNKFDEIVAFAEIEKFIETPVKHYSSGMYMRLAFAVAAYLEPEILLVDEVLAVGDAAFQKKCLGKIGDVAKDGRTVLFVSHNMAAILNLCHTGLFLDVGHTVLTGEVQRVCRVYAEKFQDNKATSRSGAFLQRIALTDAKGKELNAMIEGESLRFRCSLRAPEHRCLLSLIVRDARGASLFELFDNAFSPPFRNGTAVQVQVEAGPLPLLPGGYSVDFWLGDRMSQRLEKIDDALEFDVVSTAKTETSLTLNGSLRCRSEWMTL